jgi:CheY-like chemotaxis protein
MDADQMRLLFNDPETRAVDGKLPYGCYIANTIVTAEGGSLKIDSRPGHGTDAMFEMVFKVPQTHRHKLAHRPSSERCSTLRAVIAVRHEASANILHKALAPLMAETTVLITGQPFMSTQPFEGYDMVLIDSQLCNRAVAYGLESRGVRFVMICSIFDYQHEEWHNAADYLLSMPYTYSHLMEMMAIFFGSEYDAEAMPSAVAFDSFVSNDKIPATAGVCRKDFNRFLGTKLLIVEDNIINQRIMHGLLSNSGIKLFFAENGMEALETAVKEAPLDLILMDLHIPVMDGLEATRILRTDSRFKSTPIVAFTGLSQREQLAHMKKVGMTAHLSKPLNIGRLYTVFNHVFPRPGVAQRAR